MLNKLYQSRGWQLLLITALILAVPLMVDINGRVSVIRRMRQEQTRLENELNEVQAEHEALQAELEYVTGEAYLEHWARVEARMTRPGETAIIPLPGKSSPETTMSLSPGESNTSLSIPEQWHRLFFDTSTP